MELLVRGVIGVQRDDGLRIETLGQGRIPSKVYSGISETIQRALYHAKQRVALTFQLRTHASRINEMELE